MSLPKPTFPRIKRGTKALDYRLQTAFTFHEGGGNSVADIAGGTGGGSWSTNNNVSWSGGEFGYCLKTTGSVGVANRLIISNYRLYGGNFTLSCWVKPVGNSTAYEAILAEDNTQGLYFDATTRKFNFYLNFQDHISATAINSTSWYHYAFTRIGDNGQHYLNSVPDGSATGCTTNFYPNNMFSDASTEDYRGSIDNVLMWDRVLSLAEIQSLYFDTYALFRPRRIVLKRVFTGAYTIAAGTGAFAFTGSDAGLVYTPVSVVLQPDADASIADWTNQVGSSINIYTSIDELTADDSDYIQSPAPPNFSVARFRLSNPPSGKILGSPAIVSYRIKKMNATDQQLVVSLKQGTTLIASWTHVGTDLTTSFQTFTQTLTAELSLITNFNDLYVEFQSSSRTSTVYTMPIITSSIGDLGLYSAVFRIAAANLLAPVSSFVTQFRVTLRTYSSGNSAGTAVCYGGQRNMSGDAYDFLHTPTHITFSGSDLSGISNNGIYQSDWVNFPEQYDNTKDFLIAVDFGGSVTPRGGASTGDDTYLKSVSSGAAAVVDKSGYSSIGGNTMMFVYLMSVR